MHKRIAFNICLCIRRSSYFGRYKKTRDAWQGLAWQPAYSLDLEQLQNKRTFNRTLAYHFINKSRKTGEVYSKFCKYLFRDLTIGV